MVPTRRPARTNTYINVYFFCIFCFKHDDTIICVGYYCHNRPIKFKQCRQIILLSCSDPKGRPGQPEFGLTTSTTANDKYDTNTTTTNNHNTNHIIYRVATRKAGQAELRSTLLQMLEAEPNNKLNNSRYITLSLSLCICIYIYIYIYIRPQHNKHVR